MRVRKLTRIPRISTVAMLALIAAGCDRGEATDGISTEVNQADDAAVDDVLGANSVEANEATVPAEPVNSETASD